jgi:hypothetical protein
MEKVSHDPVESKIIGQLAVAEYEDGPDFQLMEER